MVPQSSGVVSRGARLRFQAWLRRDLSFPGGSLALPASRRPGGARAEVLSPSRERQFLQRQRCGPRLPSLLGKRRPEAFRSRVLRRGRGAGRGQRALLELVVGLTCTISWSSQTPLPTLHTPSLFPAPAPDTRSSRWFVWKLALGTLASFFSVGISGTPERLTFEVQLKPRCHS